MLFLLPRSLADVATDGREARAGAILAPCEQAAPVARSLGHQQADACRFLAILADSIESGGRAAAESYEGWQTEGLSIYRKDRLDVRYDRYHVVEACRARLVEVWACMCDPRAHSPQRVPRGPVTLTALCVAMLTAQRDSWCSETVLEITYKYVVLILSLAAGCSGHVISCDVIAGEILGDSN